MQRILSLKPSVRLAAALLLSVSAPVTVAASPSLAWTPGNGGDGVSLYQEANWTDPTTGLAPAAGAFDPGVTLNKSLYLRTGTPGGGSGAGGPLLLGTGALWVSHATLRMSDSANSGIVLGGGTSGLTIVDGKVLTEFISGGNVTLQGRSELTLYGSNPLTNAIIDLQSSDCFVFFLNRLPGAINGPYLTNFTVNGAAAVEDGNVSIRQYYTGTAIRPKPASGIGLKTFDLPNLQGAQNNYGIGFSGAIGVGSVSKTSNTDYKVFGWGNDLLGTSDQFHFLYRSMSGDGEIIARVNSVEDTSAASSAAAKGGVMIRESLAANAPFALMTQRPDNQAARVYRTSTGGDAVASSFTGGTTTDKYVRLVRSGNHFSSYYSTNSAAGPWTQIGSAVSIAMSNTVLFGLAGTSADGADVCTSVFSEVSLLQGGVPVGTSAFGIFDADQDVYSYWANEDKISSFLLKKGYQVTVAADAAGQGVSKAYIATEADLLVNLPANLDNKISWMRVLPWRWLAKKGWGGQNSPSPNVTTSGAFWNYEWEPSGGSALGREFVPMIKGDVQNKDYRWEEVRARADQTHFLCFNEPMNPKQGNLTVAEAIAIYPKALKLGLRIGSPSRTDGTDGDNWLQNFMAQAATNGYRVDYVCVHNYNKTTAAALQTWLQAEYNKYHLPIWLTEFTRDNDGTTTAAQHQAYLADVLPMLESLPFLERYAYYNFGGNNKTLFNADDSLNATGQIYHDQVSNPAYVNTNATAWCSVTLTAPTNNTSLTSNSVSLAATVSLSNAVISNVEFFADDLSLGPDTTYPYQISVTNLAAGLHTLYATATTTFGERATSTALQVKQLAVPNSAPTLLTISNRTLKAGQTLMLTNLATDPNVPPQTLSYSLISNSIGATINATSGVLTWRPTMAQGNAAYFIRVAVTDNGAPPLSATQLFTTTALLPQSPVLASAQLSNGLFQFAMSGDSGPDYTIQSSTNLTQWQSIVTNASPTLPLLWSDPITTNVPIRFYRVLLGP